MRHFTKCKPNKDIILCENDNIINHLSEVANIFNDCFTAIADGIGFNDPIPVGYENDAVLKTMIAKYDDHPSIITIKKALPMGNSFTFTNVTVNETYEWKWIEKSLLDSMIFSVNYWK